MELIYRQLHDKLTGRFDEQQLKDGLFYGVSQSLRDSSRYLYKDPTVTYQALLKAIEEMESEYGEGRATVRAKSATVAEDTGIAGLKEKIEARTTVVKSSNIVSTGMKPLGSPKPKHGNFHKFQQKDGTIPSNSPLKGKGPITSAAGPFKEGQKPIQCYNCGGWGHGWRNCPTTGNVDWRSLNRAKPPLIGNVPAPNQTPKPQ